MNIPFERIEALISGPHAKSLDDPVDLERIVDDLARRTQETDGMEAVLRLLSELAKTP